MTYPKILIAMAALVLTGAFPSLAGAAALDGKQVQIVAKVFNFLEKKPAPGSSVAVIGGAADAAVVKAALSALTVVEGGPAAATGAFAAFVASPADAQAAKATNANIITIGGDVGCVDSGACVIAIETQPKMTIYVSRAAAAKAGVDFDTSFKMLITER